MVILLSSAALESDELKKELAVADQEDVPLLAARLENVKPRAAFAYELARGNWFDVFTIRRRGCRSWPTCSPASRATAR